MVKKLGQNTSIWKDKIRNPMFIQMYVYKNRAWIPMFIKIAAEFQYTRKKTNMFFF